MDYPQVGTIVGDLMSISSGKSARKFRKLLIYPRFQLTLIGVNLSVMTVAFVVFWVTAHNILRELAPIEGLSGIEIELYKKILEYQSQHLQQMFLISFGLSLAVSFGLTLVISHRVAGPLERLKIFFRGLSLEKMPPPELQFRDGDFLSDLPAAINEAIARITVQTDAPATPKKAKA